MDAPKVLLFDIETSRTKVDVFRMGEQRISWKAISDEEFIISWAAKWLFDPENMSGVVTPKEAKKRDCKRIIKDIHRLLDQADCVITHNGDRFDIKKLNWYFIKFGLQPNNRYRSIDTLKAYRQIAAPPSAALDYLSQELGYDGKHDTNMDLWKRCEAGDKIALNEMSEYNINDVYITEQIYLRVRGWMKTHPNFAMFFELYQELEEGEYLCPRCMQSIYHTKFTRRYQTPAGYIYKSCSCPHCGAVLRKTEKKFVQTRIKVK
jgi:DNA polymerase III alpha subunit (gram-positive type)